MNNARMHDVATDALIQPKIGEVPRFIEEAWKVVYLFDMHRRAGGDCGNLADNLTIKGFDDVTDQGGHPSPDAQLLRDIMTRPVGANEPSLEDFLAAKFEKNLCLFAPIPRDPDFREFNGMLFNTALCTLDFNSIGRTLLFKGAAHLIGIPVAPDDSEKDLTGKHAARSDALKKLIFHFPKEKAEGVPGLQYSDLSFEYDPLDELEVYEQSNPQPA